MKILVTNRFGDGRKYIITKRDRLSDYVDVQGNVMEEYYDAVTEAPLSEEVHKLDEYIQRWDPENFVKLFNNVFRGVSDYYAEIIY